MNKDEHCWYSAWSDFYYKIKDPSWPACTTTHEFKFLPYDIQQEIIHDHHGLQYLQLTDDDIETYVEQQTIVERFSVANDFEVLFDKTIDGYGRYHSQLYPLILEKLYPGRVFNSCLEWCSGPGFIGFRLVADEIVKSIVMMDKFAPALAACHESWKNRPDRLKKIIMETVQGSTVNYLGDKKFDLIVANPPNFDNIKSHSLVVPDNLLRISQDLGWKTHTDFFLNIKKNLTLDGKILLCKNRNGSQPSDHIMAISDGGLKINQILKIKNHPEFYFLEVLAT